MNRREILVGAGALAVAGCSPSGRLVARAGGDASGVDPFSGAKLMSDVETYVGFGTHRTGSPGDVATTDWFAGRWRELGYDVSHTDVTCPNADTSSSRLRIGVMIAAGLDVSRTARLVHDLLGHAYGDEAVDAVLGGLQRRGCSQQQHAAGNAQDRERDHRFDERKTAAVGRMAGHRQLGGLDLARRRVS